MIKYRIIYLGDDRYLAWDADHKRFVPAGMHLYISTWNHLEDAMQEMRRVRKACSGWTDNIYLDSVLRDPLGEHRPKVF